MRNDLVIGGELVCGLANDKIKAVNLPHIKPLELSRRVEPFDHRDFVFELKHDGFRRVAYVSDGKRDLVSRRDNQYKSFDGLRDAIASELRVKNAILDGEIVCLDGLGRSQFKELLFRRGHSCFYAFDLVWLNGRPPAIPSHSREDHREPNAPRYRLGHRGHP